MQGVYCENMSSSSDEGSPPRQRLRLVESLSSDGEEHLSATSRGSLASREEGASPTAIGGGASTRRDRQAATDPVVPQRGPPATSRGRRGGRGGRGRGSRGTTREDEEEFIPHINNDFLIQLVEARPALWDHTHRLHADHVATRHFWEQVCSALVPFWEDLEPRAQEQCREKILTRWRSMRDRFKKDYNEEVRAPSGSVPSSRRQYRYQAALGFLRRTLELRRKSGGTREPKVQLEVVPEETATAGPSGLGRITSARDTTVHQPEPSGDLPVDPLGIAFQGVLRRHKAGRSRQADFEDLIRVVSDSLLGFGNRLNSLQEVMNHRQEGAVSAVSRSPAECYLMSLVPLMEQMTPEQMFEARRMVDNGLWEILHRPQSQPQSHSRPPEQVSHSHSHSFSNRPSHFLPPTSIPNPLTLGRELSSPSSSHHTPPVAFSRQCDSFSSTLAEPMQQDREGISGPRSNPRSSTSQRKYRDL
ncbi:uncharacterized protein LOC122943684 [Bufo gargarizans]|uniref:uncharacterized protein LOC122943684 n=1 Tax=Bufo gargarizans TaxID=30331 RepID=UPI001CF4127E|nr:uncharacterized protein LOC122943684 [Bufo gargarizans]